MEESIRRMSKRDEFAMTCRTRVMERKRETFPPLHAKTSSPDNLMNGALLAFFAVLPNHHCGPFDTKLTVPHEAARAKIRKQGHPAKAK
jgi:hypothetical protein